MVLIVLQDVSSGISDVIQACVSLHLNLMSLTSSDMFVQLYFRCGCVSAQRRCKWSRPPNICYHGKSSLYFNNLCSSAQLTFGTMRRDHALEGLSIRQL